MEGLLQLDSGGERRQNALSEAFVLLIPLIGVLFTAIGAFLLKRGRWPRRSGQTPHCPRCDYILSGDQQRCPECGTVLHPDTVVRGERHLRKKLMWTGTALGFVGVVMLGMMLPAVADSIDWNRHKPLSWLLRDVGSYAYDHRPWWEIQRRLNANLLSAADQDAVVEAGLRAQLAGPQYFPGAFGPGSRAFAAWTVLDYIAQRYQDNKLSASQADRFFANALKVTLLVRPAVGARSPVPWVVASVGAGPSKWWKGTTVLESQLDDGPIQKFDGRGYRDAFDQYSSSYTLSPIGKPGKHRLRVKVEMTTDPFPPSGTLSYRWDHKAPVIKRVVQDLFADFEVTEGETPIATVTSPDASVLRSMLMPELSFNGILGPQWLDMYVSVDRKLPVNAAFDVLVRFNGAEYPVGTVCFHTYSGGGANLGANIHTNAPSHADVIFRSNADVARKSPDMNVIWSGQIIVPNVPIKRPIIVPPATIKSAPITRP